MKRKLFYKKANQIYDDVQTCFRVNKKFVTTWFEIFDRNF